jgi:hypothetical protein
MCKKIILVSGYKRSGKDFVSSLLSKEIKNSTIYSFASPLKDILSTTLSMKPCEFDILKNDSELLCLDNGVILTDFRAIIQNFGNEAMKKHFGDGVWAKAFLAKKFNEQYIIISDWRFIVELIEIMDVYKKVITIRVQDQNIKNVDRHASETELETFNFDYYINNTAKDNSVLTQIQQITKEITNV